MTASSLTNVGPSSSPRSVPPCRSLGTQCRSLRVTLRIGELEEGPESLDHEATWLLGHTAQLDFHELWEGEGDLYMEAVLRSEEHTSELQSHVNLVCRLLLEK